MPTSYGMSPINPTSFEVQINIPGGTSRTVIVSAVIPAGSNYFDVAEIVKAAAAAKVKDVKAFTVGSWNVID